MPNKNDRYQFTEEQIQYIKQNWGKESAGSIAKKFGCSWYILVKVAEQLGLSRPPTKNDRLWSKEEEQMLKEMWGYAPIERIAKKLNRSLTAISVRADRLNLGAPKNNNLDYLLISQISNIFQISREQISRKWKNHGLKLYKIKLSEKKFVYGAKVEELLSFLENHQDFFDGRMIEEHILGPEPDWLKEKRKKDFQNPPNLEYYWTKQQEQYALQLLLQGKDYEEIAEKVGKEPSAVRAKLYKLYYSYQLERCKKAKETLCKKEKQENFKNDTISVNITNESSKMCAL